MNFVRYTRTSFFTAVSLMLFFAAQVSGQTTSSKAPTANASGAATEQGLAAQSASTFGAGVSQQLVLWNRLGSFGEVGHSEAGSNGTAGAAATFVPGVFGSALQINAQKQFAVTFPPSVLPKAAGCVEFWAKFGSDSDSLGQSTCFAPLAIIEAGGTAASPLIYFNGNDGAANGGLCGRLGSIGSCGTGYYGSWTYARALGGASVADWHHYALVWDVGGIACLTNPVRRMAVYVDGKLNTAAWGGPVLPPGEVDYPAGSTLGLLYLQGGTAAADNLKIWNFAKTDFGDRFSESTGDDTVTLAVSGARGAATPPDGLFGYATGTVVTATVPAAVADGGTNYVCTGATVAGNAYAQPDAATVTLTLTNDAALAWSWQTQYWLDAQAGAGGSVSPTGGWQNAGASVTLTATPKNKWCGFAGWDGATTDCAIAANSLQAPMTQARTIRALFNSLEASLAEFANLPENTALGLKQNRGTWFFSGQKGGVYCSSPKAGEAAEFEVSVQGPGALSFEWELIGADRTNAVLCKVSNKTRTSLTAAGAAKTRIVVGRGTTHILWSVQRGPRSQETTAVIRNIQWMPLSPASLPTPSLSQTVLQRQFTGLSWSTNADFYRVYAGITPALLKPLGSESLASPYVAAERLNSLSASAAGLPIYWRVDSVIKDDFGYEVVQSGNRWNFTVVPSGAPEFLADQRAQADLTVGVKSRVGPLSAAYTLEGSLDYAVTSGTIPPGMSPILQDKTVSLGGVPSKIGHYVSTVRLVLRNAKGKVVVSGTSLTFDITVTSLENAVGTFNGWIYNSQYGNGATTITVSPVGQITGKLSLRGTNYTLKASSFSGMTNECCLLSATVSASPKGNTIPITLTLSKEGDAAASLDNDPEAEWRLARSLSTADLAAVIKPMVGTYVLPPEFLASGPLNGCTAQLLVSSKGQGIFTSKLGSRMALQSSYPVLILTDRGAATYRSLVVVYGPLSSSKDSSSGVFGLFEIVEKLAPDTFTLQEVIPLGTW